MVAEACAKPFAPVPTVAFTVTNLHPAENVTPPMPQDVLKQGIELTLRGLQSAGQAPALLTATYQCLAAASTLANSGLSPAQLALDLEKISQEAPSTRDNAFQKRLLSGYVAHLRALAKGGSSFPLS